MGNSLPVLILAGGFGTRLDKISKGTPKALMPIGNGFYLDLLLEKLVNYNIDHIYLSLFLIFFYLYFLNQFIIFPKLKHLKTFQKNMITR